MDVSFEIAFMANLLNEIKSSAIWGKPERAPHWQWSIQPWYYSHVPGSLCNKHGKPHTVASRFNHGTIVTFPKVYISSTEGMAPHVACCIVRVELKVHVERREHYIESEGKEELMKKGKQGLCNATHMKQSACGDV